MELRDALRTTGAVREFADRPVPDDILAAILDDARFAPSGGNRQAWRVILVKDPEKRVRVRDLYLPGWYQYLALRAAGLVPFSPLSDRDAEGQALPNAAGIGERAQARGGGFAEHLDTAPALLVLLADLRQVAAMDREADHYPVVGGGSVYPFAWSILLGAHERGLGGVMTTVTAREEKAMYELLGVPPELVFAGLIVLGYPKASPPTRLTRGAVADFATVDSLDGPPLG